MRTNKYLGIKYILLIFLLISSVTIYSEATDETINDNVWIYQNYNDDGSKIGDYSQVSININGQ
jgi:hypothetical protein